MVKNKNNIKKRKKRAIKNKELYIPRPGTKIKAETLLITGILLIVSIVITYPLVIMQAASFTFQINMQAIAAGFVVFLISEIIYIYIHLFDRRANEIRDIALTFLIIYTVLAISIITQRLISAYTVPIAAATICVAILLRKRLGFIVSIFMAALVLTVNVASISSAELSDHVVGAILSIISSTAMIYAIYRNETRFKLIWGTVVSSIVLIPVSFVVILIKTLNTANLLIVAENALYTFIGNIIAIAIFTAVTPLMEDVFKIWSNYKLSEYSSFDQPILRELAKRAPGTFQHSISVGNMAELCALDIGENGYKARVSGYYHDVGKMLNPAYFTENQTDGFNPHDELILESSVKVIRRHTTDGYEILKRAKLPEEIAKIAMEHQGTCKVLYFYKKALSITQTESSLDVANYSYSGPKPSTKISAIIMICDVIEAVTRSRSLDRDELKTIVNTVIKDKIAEEQFDECPITMEDLKIIENTLVRIIPSMRHKRIDYKKAEDIRS